MATVDELRTQALELSVVERARLARDLILSLEEKEPTTDWSDAWSSEIEQRSADYQAGRTVARDWEDVVDRIRTALPPRGTT